MDPRIRALLEPRQYGNKKVGTNPLTSTTSDTTASSPTTKSSFKGNSVHAYDPRALLNPKGSKADRRPNRSTQAKMSAVAVADLDSPDSKAPFLVQRDAGPRSMIESLYNVEQRTERPAKRVKTSTDEDPRPSFSSSSRTGTGIIGEYMKPKQDDLKITAISDLVDLTNDDDNNVSDDDIKEINPDQQEVCFGMIYSSVQAHAIPKPSQSKFDGSGNWTSIKCQLHRVKSDNTIIEVKDPHDFIYGRLVQKEASVLAPLIDTLRKFRGVPRLPMRPRGETDWPHQPCSDHFKVMINIYGRRVDAERVAKVLGQHNIWLKTPVNVESGIPIVNLHAPRNPIAPNLVKSGGLYMADSRTVEEATEAVSKVFDHFANAAKPLDETEPPAVIISPLLSHQKQALTFMLGKESPRTYGPKEEDNSSLWRKNVRANGRIVYEDVLSGAKADDEPEQVYGGLLADVMGLGKTLEALALVATTMGEAHAFGRKPLIRDDASEVVLRVQTRATLIVAPVSTVKNWEDQIAEHIRPGGVRYCVYHGPNREKNPFKLADHDIVISTYGTISSECSKKKQVLSPIQQVRWFRIMLDEAHTIREPKAAQSQAIYGLFAQRRWALTGTPIQNRIDDLGSLVRFIRLFPYDTAARFAQYIKNPAVAGHPGILKLLRIFVDSFTLRRLRDRIDLPNRTDRVEKLDFSPEEQRLHDFFKDISRAQIEEIERNQKPVGKSVGMQHSQVLQGIMTLRLISAHGRELLKDKDLKKLKGRTQDEAIDLEEEKPPTITERAAYEALSMMADAGLDLCKNCDKQISGSSPSEEAGVRAYVLPCLDIICRDCFKPYKKEYDSKQEDELLHCPYCSLEVTAKYVAIDKSIDELSEPSATSDNNAAFKQGDYGGPHTKTKALLQDLFEMYQASQEVTDRGEAPLKAVVFSDFTSHLDLIQRALTDHGWTYVRIDGTMSLAKRRKAMDELDNNPEVRILLASIRAAGQGLNLTAASRAFIMEPLWNPAAEAQAVDRIYRLGQKREVFIKRYQMKNSIELKVAELQKKKQKLADISMNKMGQGMSKKEAREENMKDILDLFK